MEACKISLRAARVNAGLTQEQVAESLKVAKRTVQNWENGLSVPDVNQAFSLQELFRFPVGQIFFSGRVQPKAKCRLND